MTTVEILNDREVAELLFGKSCKKTSWKTVQKLARNKTIRGKRIGRIWRFHRDAVRDFLMKGK